MMSMAEVEEWLAGTGIVRRYLAAEEYEKARRIEQRAFFEQLIRNRCKATSVAVWVAAVRRHGAGRNR